MAIQELWVEKYRPTSIDQYVFTDNDQKQQIHSWITEKSIPHLLFSGAAGTGKTTLAKVLINECEVNELDVLMINASRFNGIDEIRNRIGNFVQTIPFGEFKVILLDEADGLTPQGQSALREVMETYSSTARFILTANFPQRIIKAIHSRCQGFHIEKTDMVEYTARIATILLTESIDFDLDTLDTYTRASYPDLRKCINSVEQNSISGKLIPPKTADSSNPEWRFAMVELFKSGKIQEARALLCGKAQAEEMEEIYRWLYDNLDIFGDSNQQDSAILIIKQALVDHTICADSEINLAACLIRLARLMNK